MVGFSIIFYYVRLKEQRFQSPNQICQNLKLLEAKRCQLSSGFEIGNPDHEIMIPLNVFDTVATISQPIPCLGKLCSCSV